MLADVAWIQARLANGQLSGLLADYGYARDPVSQQIHRALRLSAHILAANPGQARGQLADRMSGHPDPAVATWALSLTTHDGAGPWLASLTPTATGLEQVLTGPNGSVLAVAITADGTTAVSGDSGDVFDGGTVRVWDLATGRQKAELTGHNAPVRAVAVTPDGTTAVSSGDDGTVRVWDLATRIELASWIGDSSVVACTVLPGRPLKIAVGQECGRPYLLELRGAVRASSGTRRRLPECRVSGALSAKSRALP